jgi:hypothetical protein
VQNAGIEQDEEDSIDMSKVTAEEVFYDFNEIKQTKKANAKPIQIPKEETKTSIFTEVDSDNESDFDVKYERTYDNYDDLKPIQKPVFL